MWEIWLCYANYYEKLLFLFYLDLLYVIFTIDLHVLNKTCSFLDSLRKENERLKNDIASLTNKLNYAGSSGLAAGSSQSYRSDTQSVWNIEKKKRNLNIRAILCEILRPPCIFFQTPPHIFFMEPHPIQEWFRPIVICLTKCTFLGQAHQVNLCTYYICTVFKLY